MLADIYSLNKLEPGDFHDITQGNNGFPAGPGYDLVTGLGTPIANFIVPDLIGESQVLTSVAVTPTNPSVGDGYQLQLTGVALDQFGKPMDTQPTFTWSLVSGLGTLDANGVYTAPSSGSGTATVQTVTIVNGVTLSSTTVVNYAPGLTITAISATPGVVTGTTTTVSAKAIDPAGGYVAYFWWVASSPDGSVEALFDDPGSSTTTATFFEPGDYTLEVFAYDLIGSSAFATVNVTVEPTLNYVFLSPLSVNVPDGGQQQFTAKAYDQFFDPMPATFSWSMAEGPGTVDANGLYTAPASGFAGVDIRASATVNGVTMSGDAFPILVQPPAILSISALPNPVTSGKLSVAAYDPIGGTVSYLWTTLAAPAGVKAPTFSTAGAATTNVNFFQSGMYTFQVAVTSTEGLTTLATVNVTVNPVLTSFAITPTSASVPDGVARQFTASASDQFHQPMSAVFTWSMVSGPGSIDSSSGLYTPPTSGRGTATIKASSTVNGATLTHTAAVTLLPAPVIASISASPNPVTGTTTTLKVAASNANGGSLTYLWKVVTAPAGVPLPSISTPKSASSTATFFQSGSYSFQVIVTNQNGSTTIGTVNVTVKSVLASLVMSPATTTVARGSQQQFTVQALDQFHTAMTAPTVSWSASGLGSINSSSGLYQAPLNSKGSALIKVKVIVNGVTLTDTELVSIV